MGIGESSVSSNRNSRGGDCGAISFAAIRTATVNFGTVANCRLRPPCDLLISANGRNPSRCRTSRASGAQAPPKSPPAQTGGSNHKIQFELDTTTTTPAVPMKSERWSSLAMTNNSRSEDNITCVKPNIFCKYARSRLDLFKKQVPTFGRVFWRVIDRHAAQFDPLFLFQDVPVPSC